MRKEVLNHRWAYLLLLVLLAAFGLAFLAVWPNRDLQRILAVALGVGYVVWGVVTHVKADHFTWGIGVEYVAVAVLASSLIALVTV